MTTDSQNQAEVRIDFNELYPNRPSDPWVHNSLRGHRKTMGKRVHAETSRAIHEFYPKLPRKDKKDLHHQMFYPLHIILHIRDSIIIKKES